VDARERREVHELLVRLADGDRAALQPAFARVSPLVHAFCVRLRGGAPDAADTAQEALLRVFARLDELDPSRDAVAWALGVAAWECRTARRRDGRRRARETGEEVDPASGLPSPEDAAMDRELLEAARDVLGTLRPADAETITDALDGEREVGARFRKRLSRALERLRAEWRRRHE
jgi:RNA polymerase sigma factor (sigma-70 family)